MGLVPFVGIAGLTRLPSSPKFIKPTTSLVSVVIPLRLVTQTSIP